MLRLGVIASSGTAPPVPPSGAAIMTMVSTSPYIHAWQWDTTSGFGAKFPDPITPPPINTTYGSGTSVYITYGYPSTAVSQTGKAVFIACAQSPWIAAYRFSNLGWGTQYSNPSPVLASSGLYPNALTGPTFLTVAPDNQAIAMSLPGSGGVTPGVFVIYAWNDVSGFGAKYADPTPVPVNRLYGSAPLTFSPDGQAIAYAIASSPYIAVYRWSSSTGVGIKYADPSPIIPTAAGERIAWSRSSAILWYGNTRGYNWNSTTGFGALQFTSTPIIGSDAGANPIFSPDGQTVILDHTFDFAVYPWNDSTGFGAAYTTPAYLSTTNVVRAYSLDNAAIAVGFGGSQGTALGNIIQVGRFSNATGFGTQYANPAAPVTGTGQALAVAFIPT